MRPFQHVVWDTGKFRDLNAVAFIGAAFDDLPEKYDVFPILLYGDTVVLHSLQFPFQFGQLMIVRGK